MSVSSSSWQSRYTPAQIAAAARLKDIRERQRAAMNARLRQMREAEEAKRVAEIEAGRARQAALNADWEAKQKAAREKIAADRAASDAIDAKVKQARAFDLVSQGRGSVSPRTVIAAARRISAAYGLPVEEIMGSGRSGRLPVARAHLGVLLCIENPYVAIAGIGRSLNKDHTTILHYLATYNDFFGTNIRDVRPYPRKQPISFVKIDAEEEPPMLALMEGPAPSGMIGIGA